MRIRQFFRPVAAVSAIVIVAAGTALPAGPAAAREVLPPGAVARTSRFPSRFLSTYADQNSNGLSFAHPDSAYPYVDPEGRLQVATVEPATSSILISTFDPTTLVYTGETRQLPVLNSPYYDFGGFYVAPDGDVFTIAGQRRVPEEPKEKTYRAVEVRRYSADLHLLGVGYLEGDGDPDSPVGMDRPFDEGAAHATLVGDQLVVRMSRSIGGGAGDELVQSSLTFAVDVPPVTDEPSAPAMLAVHVLPGLGGPGFARDSWQQLVSAHGSTLVSVDHQNSPSRALQVGLVADYPRADAVEVHDVYPIASGPCDVTDATLDDVISGPQGLVVLGTHERGTAVPTACDPRYREGPSGTEMVAVHVDPDSGQARSTELSGLPAGLGVRAVALGRDRYAVLTDVSTPDRHQMSYRLVDSAGTVLASRTIDGVVKSGVTQPVLVGTRIVWAGREPGLDPDESAWLYALDVADPFEPTTIRPTLVGDQDEVDHTDFDGDGSAELALFRPATGQWLVRGSAPVAFGRSGDEPVPADYDADRKSDFAVFRPSTGQWFVRGRQPVGFGRAGDVPVPADYDGDGRADLAVFRPSTGQWFVRGRQPVGFGRAGDSAVPGDYDGDGRDEIAVYRPSTGAWYVRGGAAVLFGRRGDVAVPADYDGDGRTDRAVYRPSTHLWFAEGSAAKALGGGAGDVPRPADYESTDGRAELAVYRPSTGQWFVEGAAGVTVGRKGDMALR